MASLLRKVTLGAGVALGSGWFRFFWQHSCALTFPLFLVAGCVCELAVLICTLAASQNQEPRMHYSCPDTVRTIHAPTLHTPPTHTHTHALMLTLSARVCHISLGSDNLSPASWYARLPRSLGPHSHDSHLPSGMLWSWVCSPPTSITPALLCCSPVCGWCSARLCSVAFAQHALSRGADQRTAGRRVRPPW
jgi:hypothetical protein